jgi:apolipoprotein N-acyltransferase
VKKNLIAWLAGAMTVLAFAPFSLAPLAILGAAIMLRLWTDTTPKQAFRLGWFYGLGLFGCGVYWMYISISKFGGVNLILAILITLLFVLFIALYYGVVGWLGSRLTGRAKGSVALLLVALLWVMMEWVRGWFLTGFPWLAMGYSQIDTPLGGFAPLLGVYGVSLTVLFSAAMLARISLPGQRQRIIALGSVLMVWLVGWGLSQQQWSEPVGDPLRVSMVQGNIDQMSKWKRGQLQPTIDLYVEQTRENWQSDLIIWPETALPVFRHRIEESLLQPLAEEARENSSQLLIGIPVWDDSNRRYYNAMVALGNGEGAYYKRHLVPFGEFMPFRELLAPLLKELLQVPMANFASGESSRPLLKLAGHDAGISICYEDAFGEEMIEALPEARFLINASNDAWFGDSVAPPQHLQMARMRALESGRYMLRSTNTGVSSLINARGEVVDRSPAFQLHVLSGEIQPYQGMTPYARVGNWAVVLLLLLGVIALAVLLRRAASASSL